MSNSMIYRKYCPQCMAQLSQDAVSCACGHRFDGAAADQADEERLYEAYLAARLDQAGQAYAVAQKAFEMNPADQGKKAAAMEARHEWETVQAELKVQAERARAAEVARPARSIEPARSIKTPPSTASQSTTPIARTTKPSAEPARTGGFVHPSPRLIARTFDAGPAKKRARAGEVSPKAATKAPGQARMSADMAQRYPGLYQAFLQANSVGPSSRPDAASPKAPVKATPAAAKECPNCTALLPEFATRCKCGMTFAEGGQVTAIPALAPQAASAKEVSGNTAGTRECPHCTALLPAHATACKCGMKFPENGAATVMPALSISAEDARLLKELYRK